MKLSLQRAFLRQVQLVLTVFVCFIIVLLSRTDASTVTAASELCTVPIDERPPCGMPFLDDTTATVKASDFASTYPSRHRLHVSNCAIKNSVVLISADVDGPTPLDVIFECVTMQGGKLHIKADATNTNSIDGIHLVVNASTIVDVSPFARIIADTSVNDMEVLITGGSSIVQTTTNMAYNQIGYLTTTNASNIAFSVSGGSTLLGKQNVMSMCVNGAENITIGISGDGNTLVADGLTGTAHAGSVQLCRPAEGSQPHVSFSTIQLSVSGVANAVIVEGYQPVSALSVSTFNVLVHQGSFRLVDIAQVVEGSNNTVSAVGKYAVSAASILIYQKSGTLDLMVYNTSFSFNGEASSIRCRNKGDGYGYGAGSFVVYSNLSPTHANLKDRSTFIHGTNLSVICVGASLTASAGILIYNSGSSGGIVVANIHTVTASVIGENNTVHAIGKHFTSVALAVTTHAPYYNVPGTTLSLEANHTAITTIVYGTSIQIHAQAHFAASAAGGIGIVTGHKPAKLQFFNTTIRVVGDNILLSAKAVRDSLVAKNNPERCAAVGAIAITHRTTSISVLDHGSSAFFKLGSHSRVEVDGKTAAGAALGGVAIHGYTAADVTVESPNVFVELSGGSSAEVTARLVSSLSGYAAISEKESAHFTITKAHSVVHVVDRSSLTIVSAGNAQTIQGFASISLKANNTLVVEDAYFNATVSGNSAVRFRYYYTTGLPAATFLAIGACSSSGNNNNVDIRNSSFYLNASDASIGITGLRQSAILGVTMLGPSDLNLVNSTFAAAIDNTTMEAVTEEKSTGRGAVVLGVAAVESGTNQKVTTRVDSCDFVLRSKASSLVAKSHTLLATILGVTTGSGRSATVESIVVNSRFVAEVPFVDGATPSTFNVEDTTNTGAVFLGVSTNCGSVCSTFQNVAHNTFMITGNNTDVTVVATYSCGLLSIVAGRSAASQLHGSNNVFAAYGAKLNLKTISTRETSVLLGATISLPTSGTVKLQNSQFLFEGYNSELSATTKSVDSFYDTATVLGTTTMNTISIADTTFVASGDENTITLVNVQSQAAALGIHADQGDKQLDNVTFRRCGVSVSVSSEAAAVFKLKPIGGDATFVDECTNLAWVDRVARRIVEEVLGGGRGDILVLPPHGTPTRSVSCRPTSSVTLTPLLNVGHSKTQTVTVNESHKQETPTRAQSGSTTLTSTQPKQLATKTPSLSASSSETPEPTSPAPPTPEPPTQPPPTPPPTPPPKKVSVDTIVPVDNGEALEGSSTVATAVTGLVATPSASANVARLGAALRAIDCPLSGDDPRPSTVEHPIQFEFGGSGATSNLRWYAGSTVASTILLLAFFAQFFFLSTIEAIRDKIPLNGTRSSSLVAGASYAYFMPNIAGTATTVLVHTESGAERAACAICMLLTFAMLAYFVFMVNSEQRTLRKLRVQGGRSSTTTFVEGEGSQRSLEESSQEDESQDSSTNEPRSPSNVDSSSSGNSRSSDAKAASNGDDNKAEIIELPEYKDERVLARLGIFFDATLRIREALPRNYYAIDICVASFATMIAGTRPNDNCDGVAAAIAAISFLAILYYVIVRPFSRKIEATFAILIAVNQFLLGAMSIIAIRSDSFSLHDAEGKEDKSTFATIFGHVVMFQMVVFFLQAFVQGAWAILRFQRRRHVLLNTQHHELEEALLVPPDTIDESDSNPGKKKNNHSAPATTMLTIQPADDTSPIVAAGNGDVELVEVSSSTDGEDDDHHGQQPIVSNPITR